VRPSPAPPAASAARPAGSLALALASPSDPRERGAYSGWPASLLDGLERVVGTAIGLDGSLPARLELAATLAGVVPRLRPRDLAAPRAAVRAAMPSAWFLGRPVILARSARVRRALRRAGPLDGCVLFGTELSLPRTLPTVTFQDSTIIQARRSYPWPYLGTPTERETARAAERQRTVYRAARACCTSSQWAADSIVGDYGIPREKVHVVGIGRNHDVAAPAARDWAAPRFLFVGLDWTRKNGPMTVEAFAEVRRRHPGARLDLVGGHPPIAAPGVTGHGVLSLDDPADRERLAALYRGATCFVMPSRHEPSATAYAEAAAAGLPCIGTTDGGSATVIGPGGVLVDPADPRGLAQAMLRLADPGTARRLGALAAEHAERLTWEKVAERLVRALAPPGCDTARLAAFL
jgi:glycosyltransferase involved in cell wall biosynthesis